MENKESQTLNIFLSYQWKCQNKVKQLFHELNYYKYFDVFMDIYKIKAGMNLYSTLASNIQQADVILACISRDYVKSKNCEREIIFADNFNKPIIPVYVEKIPISELGGIGFVLIRERYCNMYRNDKIFDSLNGSEEFKDLLDGIFTHAEKLKINVSKELKENVSLILDESNIDQSIIKFRSDAPLEDVFTQKPIQVAENKAEPPAALPSSKKPAFSKKVDETSTNNSKKSSNFANYFQIHPCIKELDFLLKPKVLLDPMGDRFSFDHHIGKTDLKRGGLIYYPPVGWTRYGINIKILFPDINKWLSKDGNKDEWTVAYHGFKQNPMRSNLYYKLFDKSNQFKPNFIPSKNLAFANLKDSNKNSDTYNSSIGLGIICSNKPDVAEQHTVCFSLNKIKYKMLLQLRVNPTKIKIPPKTNDLYILSNSDHIRPYGILIKEIA